MADNPPTPPANEGDPPTPPTPPTVPNADNSTIQQMRAEIDRLKASGQADKARADELAAKLKEREDADLSEIDRLKKQNQELQGHQATADKYRQTMTELYDAELAAAPEDKREQLKAVSQDSDPGESLKRLRSAKALLGTAPPPPTPPTPNPNPPGGPPNPAPPQATKPSEFPKLSQLTFKK